MNSIVRLATENDMNHVLELIKELAIFEKEPDAVEITVQDLIRDGFSNPPLFICFVAEQEQKIVGMALVYDRFSTWKGRTLHLEDLIVTQTQRGKGIGKALYTQVLEFAAQEGVKRVEWVVLDWNKGAIQFYEESGATLLKDWYLVQMDEGQLHTFLKK